MARLVPPLAHPSHADATAIADGSTLLRAIERLFGATAEGWRTSKASARIERTLNGDTRRGEQAIRLAGWMGLSAIVTRIAIVGFDGLLDESASGLGWFAALPFAVACLLRPAGVLMAWGHLRHRRVFAQPRRY